MTTDAYIYDAIRTPRGRGKESGSLHPIPPLDLLKTLFDAWSRFPEEAGYWRITFRYGRPKISPDETFPYWYPRGETTMETTTAAF